VCWGQTNYGQTSLLAGSFMTIAAGRDHACGPRTDGTAVCWDSNANYNGELNIPPGVVFKH
jgi:hypothetical protein